MYSRCIRTRSYLDKASVYDSHNRVFYIYELGRYNNIPMYRYGETNDVDLVELQINAKLPMYKKVATIPVDAQITSLDRFHEYIAPCRRSLPVEETDEWNIFAADSISEVLQQVNEIYQTYTDYYS